MKDMFLWAEDVVKLLSIDKIVDLHSKLPRNMVTIPAQIPSCPNRNTDQFTLHAFYQIKTVD